MKTKLRTGTKDNMHIIFKPCLSKINPHIINIIFQAVEMLTVMSNDCVSRSEVQMM